MRLPAFRALAQFNESFAQVKGDEKALFAFATKRKKMFDFYKPDSASLARWPECGGRRVKIHLVARARDDGWVATHRTLFADSRREAAAQVARRQTQRASSREIEHCDVDMMCAALVEIAAKAQGVWRDARGPLVARIVAATKLDIFGTNERPRGSGARVTAGGR
jgi:hypothetical protein